MLQGLHYPIAGSLAWETMNAGHGMIGRASTLRPEQFLDVTESFANQAALALELSDSRADQQRLTLLEDRDRIARDLHDHVIQRLFATGLFIRAAASMVPNPEVNARFLRRVEDLDETIKQIRMSIFHCAMSPGNRPSGIPYSRWSRRQSRRVGLHSSGAFRRSAGHRGSARLGR